MPITTGYSILTRAIKHQIDAQPANLADVTKQQQETIAILMLLKNMIRSEYAIRMYRAGFLSTVLQ